MTVDDDGGAPDADAAVPPIALRVGGVDANTRASAVLALDDGGALVVMSSNGAVVDAPVGFIDTIVYRLARDGGLVWSAQLGDVGLFVKGWDVALGPSGDVLVTGLVNGRGTLAGQTLVATYSGFVASFDFAEGTRRWVTLLTDASGDVELMGVEVTPAGDVVVAGYSGAPTLHGQPSLGDGDIVLAWLTPEGAITRVRRYGDANEEHPTAFVRSGANLFITRKVVSPNLGQVLALELLALDAEGEVTATRPFAMPAMNEIAALAAHPGGVCAGLWHRTFTEETGSGIDWGISCHDAALDVIGAARGGAPGARASVQGLACDEAGACTLVGGVDTAFEGEAIDATGHGFLVALTPAFARSSAMHFGPSTLDETDFARATAVSVSARGTFVVGDVSGALITDDIGRSDAFVATHDALR